MGSKSRVSGVMQKHKIQCSVDVQRAELSKLQDDREEEVLFNKQFSCMEYILRHHRL